MSLATLPNSLSAHTRFQGTIFVSEVALFITALPEWKIVSSLSTSMEMELIGFNFDTDHNPFLIHFVVDIL